MTIINLPHEFGDLDELIGKPLLLTSQDRDIYELLEKELVLACKPKTLLDSIDVRDLAIAIWEAGHFREQSIALVNAERPKVLKKLIDAKVKLTKKVRQLADAYLAEPSETAESKLLNGLGINSVAVDALAMLAVAKEFIILDKFVTSRNATRRSAAKDYLRQRDVGRARAVAAKLKKTKNQTIKDDFGPLPPGFGRGN